MLKLHAILFSLIFLVACSSTRNAGGTKVYDQRVKITTDSGVIIIRLYDKTPLHRDNFIKLVKQHYFDSVLFHRVIKNFMIQGGDPDSKHALPLVELGNGGPGYTIPAEFDTSLFHKKGVLAAAREGDDVNPKKKAAEASSILLKEKYSQMQDWIQWKNSG